LDDPHVQHRIEIENTILGLANLYGQVSLSFVCQELVRLGKAQTKEDAIAAVSACRDNSLWLKWAEHSIENFQDEPTDEGLLFLSPYGWSMPLELKHEIAMREELAKDYQLFPATDIMSAAVMPIPKIANPIHEAFVEMLTSDLELDNSQATVVCHELWYREMHKYEEVFEEEDPGAYFREEVLYDYDSYDGIFKKAMKMLDDYLNNMPHWQLKGHTPMEAQAIIDARRSITMPIISAKKPGRNDPCPCGSGKKYKNCCGRGN